MPDRDEPVVIHEENSVLRTIDQLEGLAERLADCPGVSRYNKAEQIEAWHLADSLGELEKVMRRHLVTNLPRLAAARGAEEIEDALLEMGEGFRWMIYYIVDHQEYFKYIAPGLCNGGDEESGSGALS